MNGVTGRLWVDVRKDMPVADKVLIGARHYATKYGEFYLRCHVHPSMLSGLAEMKVGPVAMVADADFQPNYFWYTNEVYPDGEEVEE